MANPKTLADLLDEAAAVLADSNNYPIFFHCHHGLNRASMAQIAYRTKYCGWTLDQATDEIANTVGLVKVTHGPDYRRMVDYYNNRVLPFARLETRPPRAAEPASRSRPRSPRRHPRSPGAVPRSLSRISSSTAQFRGSDLDLAILLDSRAISPRISYDQNDGLVLWSRGLRQILVR